MVTTEPETPFCRADATYAMACDNTAADAGGSSGTGDGDVSVRPRRWGAPASSTGDATPEVSLPPLPSLPYMSLRAAELDGPTPPAGAPCDALSAWTLPPTTPPPLRAVSTPPAVLAALAPPLSLVSLRFNCVAMPAVGDGVMDDTSGDGAVAPALA